MPVVETSPVEEKKPKKEPTSVKKRKREPEGKHKPKSNFQEYLEMEMGGSVSREEDLEMERRLAKQLKLKKGKLGGDDGMDDLFAGLGFNGDFGSDNETETCHLNMAGGTKLDKEKGKKKNKKGKKDAMQLEESDDASLDMGEESDGSVFESEDEAKLNKKRSKKKKKKGKKDAMELGESNDGGLDMGEESDGPVLESNDLAKLGKKKRKKKNKKAKKDAVELEETDNGGINMGEDDDGSFFESEDGDDRSVDMPEEDDEAVSASEDEEPNMFEVPTESKGKYVPPSLRAAPSSESEEITQMRRRVRGMALNSISYLLDASHLSIFVFGWK
jgi:nucleolar MIF4G domain-containing protein 1